MKLAIAGALAGIVLWLAPPFVVMTSANPESFCLGADHLSALYRSLAVDDYTQDHPGQFSVSTNYINPSVRCKWVATEYYRESFSEPSGSYSRAPGLIPHLGMLLTVAGIGTLTFGKRASRSEN